MDHPSRLRCFGSIPYSPLSDFVCSSGEEAPQIHHCPHSCDDFRQRRLRTKLFTFFRSFGIVLKPCKTLFESHRERQYGIACGICFYPFSDLGKMFVLLTNVVLFTEVDKEDDWLGG